ncbi:hypothetical protein ABT121_13170 [Streptomyces sp. NPDC001928]
MSSRTFARIAGGSAPSGYRRGLARFQFGPDAAKVAFLVSEPIPGRTRP